MSSRRRPGLEDINFLIFGTRVLLPINPFLFFNFFEFVNVFFRAIVLSMVNTWLSLFSPYFRKCENGVLGYSFWWSPNDIVFVWSKTRREKSLSQRRIIVRRWSRSQRSLQRRRLWEASQNEERSRYDVLLSRLVGCDVR